jgi:hypothetical protein
LDLSLGRFGLVDSFLQSTGGFVTRPLLDLFPVSQQNHVWDWSDIVPLAEPPFSVDVDGQNSQLASIVLRELPKLGINSYARTAPLGAELYQYQSFRSEAIELPFGYVDGSTDRFE